MSQEGRVSTEQQGHVLLIGLDRVAKRNSFDWSMLSALGLAYAELEGAVSNGCSQRTA